MAEVKKYPWGKNTERDKTCKDLAIIQAALSIKAKEITADDKFKEYKNMFVRYQEETIEHIISFKEDDPIKYAFKVRQLIDTLKAYRLLISSVEEDAAIHVEDQL